MGLEPEKGFSVTKKRHNPEQIVAKLRQADIEPGKGRRLAGVCKQLGIKEQTYYRWPQNYGGMDPQIARHTKALVLESGRCHTTLGGVYHEENYSHSVWLWVNGN